MKWSGVPITSGGSTNPIIISNCTKGTTTGGSAYTYVASHILPIPAGTLPASCMLTLDVRGNKTGTSNNLQLAVYKNTSATLSGASIIGYLFHNVFATHVTGLAHRSFWIDSGYLYHYDVTVFQNVDWYSWENNPRVSFNVNEDNYIIVAARVLNGSDLGYAEFSVLTAITPTI